jgi:chemotaxis protein methyltransferase CheR
MGCSEADLAYLRDVVRAESSNVVDPARTGRFEARLTPVAERLGVGSVGELVGLLREDRAPHLHRAVAEAMTVNETSFFRDRTPFEVVRETILPELIERNRASRRLHLWSAGCSTGQEAYSLALLVCEHFPELASWDVKIVGTDLSQAVVAHARRGRYGRLEVNRGLPARMLVKYFARYGEEWEVAPRLRGLCEFQAANLRGPMPELPVFDLVMLRNVLLYFPQQERGQVFEQVHRLMARGGYLMLGAAEQAEDSTTLFEAEFAGECFFYRPRAQARARAEDC